MLQWALMEENRRVQVLLDIETDLWKPIETHNSDGMPITTIHVTNIPKQLTRNSIIGIFRRFGKVCNTYFRHAIDDRSHILYAFITYNDVHEAQKARSKCVKAHGTRLKVSAADPWHQKSREKTFTEQYRVRMSAEEPMSDEESKSEVNILDTLNEDCFLKILSYLTLQELIRTERVSQRWKYLVTQRLQGIKEFKARDFTSIKLQTHIFYCLLKKIGSYLRTLHLDQEWPTFDQRTPFVIAKFCPNLTELVVTNLISSNWNGVMENCVNLKSLTFKSCSEISDKTFKPCKAELEELVISQTERVLGGFLKYLNLKSLKKLMVTSSPVLEIPFCKNFEMLKGLEYLCLDDIHLTPKAITMVLNSVPNLVTLSLCNMDSGAHNLDLIAKLHELRCLRLAGNHSLNNKAIKNICKGCPNLTLLDISLDEVSDVNFHAVRVQGITDQIIPVILSLKNLESLNISGINITDEAFICIGNKGIGNKLKELICRDNETITEISILHIFTYCPEIKKIDLFNCKKISIDIINKIIEVIHMKECIKDRYHLNTSWLNAETLDSCQCLVLKYEHLHNIVLFGSLYSDDEDEDYRNHLAAAFEDDIEVDDILNIDVFNQVFLYEDGTDDSDSMH